MPRPRRRNGPRTRAGSIQSAVRRTHSAKVSLYARNIKSHTLLGGLHHRYVRIRFSVHTGFSQELSRILGAYAAYYNQSRTHRSLNKDAPFHRAIERLGAHHHVTPNSRWTSPPILQNLIFGTLRFSVHTGWTMSPPRCPGVRTPITRPIIPGLRTCSSVWRPLRDELRSRSSSLSLMQQKFPDRRDQQQISSNLDNAEDGRARAPTS